MYGVATVELGSCVSSLMKYVVDHDIPRFCQFATRVFDVEMNHFDPKQTALEGIRRLECFFKSIDMPIRLHELGVCDQRFEEMAHKLTRGGTSTIGNFVQLNEADCREIYEMMV